MSEIIIENNEAVIKVKFTVEHLKTELKSLLDRRLEIDARILNIQNIIASLEGS